jgi:hypothetical protein
MDKEYFRARREQRRQKFKDLLGGRCIICGSKKNLQFDHKDPKKKEFRISLMIDSPEQKLLNELKKCQLLCARCHHKKTLEKQEFGIESSHGSIWRYKKYKCRCAKCRKAMSEYNKNLRKRQLQAAAGIVFDPEIGHLKFDNPEELDRFQPHDSDLDKELLDKIKTENIGTVSGMDAWLVDGELIRNEVDVDWTTGGNPFRYSYVEPGELWIEKTSSPNDTIAIAVHERIESHLMDAEGLEYGDAHDATNVYEISVRKAIDDGHLSAKTHKEAVKLADEFINSLKII